MEKEGTKEGGDAPLTQQGDGDGGLAVVVDDPYLLSAWYPYLANYTFETALLPISLKEGQAILNFIEEHTKSGGKRYTDSDEKRVSKLMKKIDRLAKPLRQPNGGFFVKMASRSAKDIVLASQTFEDLVIRGLAEYVDVPHLDGLTEEEQDAFFDGHVSRSKYNLTEGDHFVTSNAQMLSFSRASVKVLETFSGKQAMDTFMRSKRTYGDIKQRELLGNDFTMDIVVRRWHEELRPEYEFRGFVFDGNFCALTQYYQFVHIPDIVHRKEEIGKRILSFWEKNLKDLIVPSSYTVDFVILSSGKIMVIELNPPAPLAGSSLFEWPRDRKLLEELPFTFRVVEAPSLIARSKIYERTRLKMDELFPNYALLHEAVLARRLHSSDEPKEKKKRVQPCTIS